LGNPKYLDYVGGIHESGQHLLDLITDILDMSKIEAGKYELDIEDVNIAKSIALTLHMMEGRALDAKVNMLTGPALKELGEEGGPHIKADRRALMQILLNLMSNAVKFTPEGGSVTADCTVQKKNIKITVKDTGIGIPANKLANVLMPFEQAAHEHTRDHEGSGLGLSITKELAELHGGSIKITSKVGEGTCVTVTLPFEPQIKSKN
jgi:two-component system cell cycle sensor histidine kinase PleC